MHLSGSCLVLRLLVAQMLSVLIRQELRLPIRWLFQSLLLLVQGLALCNLLMWKGLHMILLMGKYKAGPLVKWMPINDAGIEQSGNHYVATGMPTEAALKGAQVFGIVPLSLNELLLVIAVAFPVILIDKVFKFIERCTTGLRHSAATKPSKHKAG
ncbi:hypothetical protein CRYUN_Cryun25bG0111500 [Craigia yunnanensis]